MAREPRKLVSFQLGTYDNAVLDRLAYLTDTSKSDLMRKAIKELIEEFRDDLMETWYDVEEGQRVLHKNPTPEYHQVFNNPPEVSVEAVFREEDDQPYASNPKAVARIRSKIEEDLKKAVRNFEAATQVPKEPFDA